MAKRSINPVLEVNHLGLQIGETRVLEDVNFCVLANEIVALVGESGSGKSVTAHSIMGLLPSDLTTITQGTIRFENETLHNFSLKEWQNFRGNRCSMIFQEPQSSLNPSMRCGKQVAEMGLRHLRPKPTEEALKKRILAAFTDVQLPNPERIYTAYPHELSGGQKQRVMIAMALLCAPKLLIADEPTTALDVLVQKELITLLKRQQQKNKMSILFISHDLNVVAQLADKIAVMKAGKIVEFGTANQLLKKPSHPYTRALLSARPPLDKRLISLPTLQQIENQNYSPQVESKSTREKRHQKLYQKSPLLKIEQLEKSYLKSRAFWKRPQFKKALQSVSFSLFQGETLGIVGASGCGKSTLARAIVQLTPNQGGAIYWENEKIDPTHKKQVSELRKNVQFIFQDPYAALHPQKTMGQILDEVLLVHQALDVKRRKARIRELLAQVDLPEDFTYRYPHQLSGGQRQRFVIARALAVEPQILICDESVAALDISVQAQVLNLLNSLKQQLDLSLIFISHDLAVVKHMADRILVMNEGKIVEENEADMLYRFPKTPFAKALIKAIE